MKVVLINKSDSTGGAAIVSRRLMEALRSIGVDARMLVCERLSDSPYVELAASPGVIKRNFLLERLKVFYSTGFNRYTLFKIDTGDYGLPLWNHPWVRDADAVLLNWVNQGMLSLSGVRKILQLGKPVLWTMHDMWCLTGICHHAGTCINFTKKCGNCPLLGKKASYDDLSYKTWQRKSSIYFDSELNGKLAFVPVSRWLEEKVRMSSLLRSQKTVVIPNAFNPERVEHVGRRKRDKIRLLFGAARLDDPIKGLDTLRLVSEILSRKIPDSSEKIEIGVFGNVKNSGSLEGFSLPLVNLGVIRGDSEVAKAYALSEITVSASSYETLPGTLVEAQAYGSIPVSFNRGGQSDIVQHEYTGFLAEFDENIEVRAENLARQISRAAEVVEDPLKYEKFRERMLESVKEKFSYSEVAGKYVQLIESLRHGTGSCG